MFIKTNNCGNPAGRWDTYNVACNQISHSALKGDEVFQSGTYFLPAHVFWCLFSQRGSQVGSETAVVQVPNGSCRHSLLKSILPPPAKWLSTFSCRSILALWNLGRGRHVVAGLALLPAWNTEPMQTIFRRLGVWSFAWPIVAGYCQNCCRCFWQLTQWLPPFTAPIRGFFWNSTATTAVQLSVKWSPIGKKLTEWEIIFHDTV